MKRRDLLKTGLIAGAALTAPARAFAAPQKGSARDRALFDIAKLELDRAGDAIWKRDIVGIADFGLHSAERRFHFVNLEREEVQSYHVSHGTGSDPEHDGFLNSYSNVEGSLATSRGAYVTWECFAMAEEQFRIALMNLSGGRLLFADSLGLAQEGERLATNTIELLQPTRPLASQRYNPATY